MLSTAVGFFKYTTRHVLYFPAFVCCFFYYLAILPCVTMLHVMYPNPAVNIRDFLYFLFVRWRFGAVGSNEVTLRRAWLVLGWVTVSGFNSRCGKFI